MNFNILLNDFLERVENNEIEIYNEFSLQHELGICLRTELPDYKVQFERNTKYFGISALVKHEIDIVIYNDQERIAIELKYPVNGQYPEEMFSFIKDIKFMEQMKESGFDKTYCLTLVDDKNFYSGKKIDGIYSYFRNAEKIQGTIIKPTGKKDEIIDIHGGYNINWNACGNRKYYLLEI